MLAAGVAAGAQQGAATEGPGGGGAAAKALWALGPKPKSQQRPGKRDKLGWQGAANAQASRTVPRLGVERWRSLGCAGECAVQRGSTSLGEEGTQAPAVAAQPKPLIPD
jgi:hypothetical protein